MREANDPNPRARTRSADRRVKIAQGDIPMGSVVLNVAWRNILFRKSMSDTGLNSMIQTSKDHLIDTRVDLKTARYGYTYTLRTEGN